MEGQNWCRRGESEFGASLIPRKLLIPLNEKNAKKVGFGKVRYTPGTRDKWAHTYRVPSLFPRLL